MNQHNVPHSRSDQQPYPLIVYQPEGSELEIKLSADPEHRTVWATQRQIADALGITVQAVSHQIVGWKKERGERANPTIKKYLIVAEDGKRREVEHYDMTVVTFVGFRAQATERAIRFQNWVGKELDRILREKQSALSPAQVTLALAEQLVEQERDIRELELRQTKSEHWQGETDARVSRLEARQISMVDNRSQHMSIIAYCQWKQLDADLISPRYLPSLTEKAIQISRDRNYSIGKTPNRSGYDDTFHLDVLTEIFTRYN